MHMRGVDQISSANYSALPVMRPAVLIILLLLHSLQNFMRCRHDTRVLELLEVDAAAGTSLWKLADVKRNRAGTADLHLDTPFVLGQDVVVTAGLHASEKGCFSSAFPTIGMPFIRL